MGFGDWWNTNVSGNISQDNYNAAPQVSGINPSTYQIPGMQNYASQQQGLGQQAGQLGQAQNAQMGGFGQQIGSLQGSIPGAPDLNSATGGTMQNQQALQSYLQKVAMGQAPSAADQMLQNQQGMLARQQQSQAVSAGGGMNPALAMRQLFQNNANQNAQLAGQGAAQKLQEQQAFGGMAQQGNQQLYNNQFQNAQQGFQNQNTQYNQQLQNVQNQAQVAQQQFQNNMTTNRAQQDVANGIMSANRAQTNYNVEAAQNQQAFQQMQRAEYMQHQQDLARSHAALGHALVSGLGTAGGAVAGGLIAGPMGAMAGSQLGGSLANGLIGGPQGGGGGGMDPTMLAMMMQQRQGQGDPNDPNNPNGLGPSDAGVAPGMYRDPIFTGQGNQDGGISLGTPIVGNQPNPGMPSDASGYSTGMA